ncbi:hypothetical protein COM29_31820, partial [Bacillus toyonensis]
MGAANQGQTGHSDQTEQQALQHALLSRIRHRQAGSIAVGHCGSPALKSLTKPAASGSCHTFVTPHTRARHGP